MRIMYDITPLGQVMALGWRCAGICRVTKSLLAELSDREDVSVSTYLGYDPATIKGSLDALPAMGLTTDRPSTLRFLSRLGGGIPPRGRPAVTGFRKPIRELDLRGLWREWMLRSQYRADGALAVNAQGHHSRELTTVDVFHDMSFPSPNPSLDDSLDLRSRAIPAVITVYDLIPMLYPHYFGPGVSEQFTEQVGRLNGDHWILCSSDDTRAALTSVSKVDPARVRVVPWAASRDTFFPCADLARIDATKSKYGIPDGPYVLSLCTLEPRKNTQHLIDCFVEMVTGEKIRDLSLVLVGGSGWIPEVNRRIAEAASQHRAGGLHIVTTGYVNDEDLAPLYSGATMFVYPSLVEGFGLPPLEAMQCGVPVISSDASAMPEVLGDAGLLVAPQDASALIQAMLNVYRSSDLRTTLSLKAIAQSDLFSWRRCADETVAIYEQAIS